MTFPYITGWRIASEVSTLQWRQVDMTERLSPDQDIPGDGAAGRWHDQERRGARVPVHVGAA